jgi:hypothetical protein
VPAKQRLRRHDQPVPTPRREHPAERREKGAIGCSKRRPLLLPPEHRELMAKNEQFDILGELAAAATHEKPQQRREREIRERKEHPPMLPDLAPDYIDNRNLVLEPLRVFIRPLERPKRTTSDSRPRTTTYANDQSKRPFVNRLHEKVDRSQAAHERVFEPHGIAWARNPEWAAGQRAPPGWRGSGPVEQRPRAIGGEGR